MARISSISKSLGVISAIILGAVLTVSPAMAATITFNFTGTVTSVGSNLTGTFSNGQTLTGSSYAFNSLTADSKPADAKTGKYEGTISNLVVNIGSYNATLGDSTKSVIEIKDETDITKFDKYTMETPFTGDPVNTKTPDKFEIKLEGAPSTTFTTDALPTTPPTIGSFPTKTFRLIFSGGGNSIVSGTLDTLTAVPLPAAAILFGAGIIALVGLGAGSWRQKKNTLA